MSYDVTIGSESFNYTSNVHALFYDHIPATDNNQRGGIHAIHGLTGRQAALIIGGAFTKMNETRHKLWSNGAIGEPAMCARYDAQNGWGSMVGAILFLGMIMDACNRYPRSKVEVYA